MRSLQHDHQTDPTPDDQRHSRWRRRTAAMTMAALSLGTAAFALGPPQAAQASTFDVTITTDGGPGSLRDAVVQANAHPGPDTIHLPAGTYGLSIPGAGENSGATGDLDISGDTTIAGSGAAVTTIDAHQLDRVIDVFGGSLSLQGVTITGGLTDGTGGGIESARPLTVTDAVIRGNDALGGGGLAAWQGPIVVQRSEIRDNTVHSKPGNGSFGGGLSINVGPFTMDDSTVAGNQALPDGNGGGVEIESAPSTITNSTIVDNHAGNMAGGLNADNAKSVVNLRHVTVAGNSAVGGYKGGGVFDQQGATISLQSSLLVGNTMVGNVASNCGTNTALNLGGFFTSAGGNLSDDTSCQALVQPSDHNDDHKTALGPLAANGGLARTMALPAGSSAIDAAPCLAAVTTDERHHGRPAGASCDAGAFEADSVVIPTTTSTSTSSTTTSSTSSSTSSTSSSTSTTRTTALPTTTTTAPTTTTSTSSTSTTRRSAPTTDRVHVLGASVARPAGSTSIASVPTASGTLPVTGTQALRLLLVGLGLVLVGGVLLAEARRRRPPEA